MADVLALEQRARTAYELGRLKMAARVLPWVAALAAFGLIGVGVRGWVVASGATLVVFAVLLRWRSRAGVEDVWIGLQASLLPLAAGVWLCRVQPTPPFSPLSLSGAACVALGALTGIWIGIRSIAVRSPRIVRLAAVLALTTLAAALGCADLGIGNLAGMAIGMTLGSFTVFATARPKRAGS